MCIRDSLSNGDVVTYTWDGVNEQTKKEAEEMFGVKIKCSDVTYKAVSYTHLDVYKRQCVYDSPPGGRRCADAVRMDAAQ